MASTKMPAPHTLMHTLSAKPPSTCRAEPIDFEQAGIQEYRGRFAMLIHDLLSPTECEELLEAALGSSGYQWEEAMVNVGFGMQERIKDIRDCGRIIWDTPEVVDKLLERIKPHLPQSVISLKDSTAITGAGPVRRKETWDIARLNERLRFLKYTKGMYFREHCDGSYVTPKGDEISFLTVHLYLNSQGAPGIEAEDSFGSHHKPLKGGATRFFGLKNNVDVNPVTGACLVFQHKGLYHSGEEVEEGTKYTVRTDIMYKKAEEG
ncbi:hypothetical protein LTR70_000713 [Exophiala xenobiotica]|uniref:Prolyl 4-hydroxylase alpha subunit domain-containing protein n=1 Tax=Lithohypha guttulata TaxID=1690604 RepID=A0ABR0KQ47_9EURO|nr:hypothetical protein LTR24_000616 [Lithohypha guttulata]KAK5329216.1 hypothetical protein LTR70_000713 [Exophiala xenobiotica]